MVDEGMPHRLKRLREVMLGVTYEEFGRLAGVKAQAAHKWLHGGQISDATLRRLVEGIEQHYPHVSADFFELKYGKPREALTSGKRHEQHDALRIFEALPKPQREDWLRIGEMMVERHTRPSPPPPFKRALRGIKLDGK